MLTLIFPKLVLIASFFAAIGFAASLPKDEVQALQDIATTMGKTEWDFSVDPCKGHNGWLIASSYDGHESNVTCNCSFQNNTVCHVVAIVLKRQNLAGKLPPELVRLPYLQYLDLTRNYLNGTIPPGWGSMKLVHIALTGNRLTGSIPKEIGNISTLRNLTIQYNQLSGSLPWELGNLRSIERLLVTSNNLSGELPETLANLTALKNFHISDNHFTGTIPNYIRNWKNLELLFVQASGLGGPIPSGIADLVNLWELRISDLNGPEQPFPPLNNMIKMRRLILRSCNIGGQLPEYLTNMTKLIVLDLSFNKLSGKIPSNYSKLASVIENNYLTGNMLNGTVQDWILNEGDKSIDLSYNNFADTNLGSCSQRTVNLFASSSNGNNSAVISCLKSFQCPEKLSYLHINSGGESVTVGRKITYEADTDIDGPARFFQSKTNWAYINTGHFVDGKHGYVWSNVSELSMKNPELYMTARVSPISLTYYGFCLENGSYTVSLHFAEIVFTDDKTYSSLGRRVFDVYIQGNLVLKDFDIAAEAGGVGKEIIKKFTAAVNSTLEIRFFWAGKGTDGIPEKGVYGPLISAISVNPDFTPPTPTSSSSGLMTVGIVAPAASLLLLVVGILWWKGCLGHRNTMLKGFKGLEMQVGSFTLRKIQAATDKFDVDNKIGEGGFGTVYKGCLPDGTMIAVKQLSPKSTQGIREFVNEVGMISAIEHANLVKLYGCCIEGDQMLLVYEYLENNCLARALFGREEQQLRLEWQVRQKICVGIARGLAYLHEGSKLRIVHRDIKATNVLLDNNLNPKISDFGLAKLNVEDHTHISTRVAGTFGYMAPEYAMRGYLTDKADVYSFGIVALEIVSGRSNINGHAMEDSFNLLDWALVLKEREELLELVDPRLGSDFSKEEATRMINVGLLCTTISPSLRPSMSSVLTMLEGATTIPDPVSNSGISNEKAKLGLYATKHYELIQEHIETSEIEIQTLMTI